MHPQSGPPGNQGRKPSDMPLADGILRARRGWKMPGNLRPEDVPATRPRILVAVAVVYLLDLLAHTVMLVLNSSSGSDIPLTTLGVALVVAAIRIVLLVGVWTGREVARWLVVRLGVGIGVIELFMVMLSWPASTGSTAALPQPSTVASLVAAVLLAGGGLLAILPGVRAWCAGRWF